MYQRYAAASLAHVESANKRMELWEDQFKEWWKTTTGMNGIL